MTGPLPAVAVAPASDTFLPMNTTRPATIDCGARGAPLPCKRALEQRGIRRRVQVLVLLVALCVGCTATGRSKAVEGAAIGGIAGAVGGALTAAIFGGNVGRAAARGAVWGGSTGAVAGGLRGDMQDADRRRQRDAAQQRSEVEEIESLRLLVGDDNLAGLEALATCKYEVASAYAKVAARSNVHDHALSARWLEALVYADRGDRRRVQGLQSQLVDRDSDVHSVDQADAVLWELLQELRQIRAQYGLPATCAA